MTSTEVQNLQQGDWFISNDMLMYVAKKSYNGIFYGSHSFLSLQSSVNFIGYEDAYSLIHANMEFIGKTKDNFLYWILPTYFAQFVCPYTLPSKKQLSTFV